MEGLLAELGLTEYQQSLQDGGYRTLQDLRVATVDDLINDINVKKPHAKRIMAAAAAQADRDESDGDESDGDESDGDESTDSPDAAQDVRLIDAARDGNLEEVQRIVQSGGVDVDAQTHYGGDAEVIYGRTALMFASGHGHFEVAKALLAAGADTGLRDDDAETALEIAEFEGHSAIIALLSITERLNGAAEAGQLDEVQRIVLSGDVDVDRRDSFKLTALMLACGHGHREIAEVLVDSRASVDAKNACGATSLILASHHGHLEVVKFLLHAGADASLKMDNGQTALDAATVQGHSAITALLEIMTRESKERSDRLLTGVKKGRLLRKGDIFPWNWSERWFELTDGQLTRFEKNGGTAKGYLAFSAGDCSVRETADARTFIIACGGTEWKLKAASAVERAEWVADIQHRADKLEAATPEAKEQQAIFASLQAASGCELSIEGVQELVGPRLLRVKERFPSATHDQLCQALLEYSPESALFARGLKTSQAFDDGQWQKYQGELKLGSYSEFHNGVAEIIGENISDLEALAAIHDGIMRDGKPDEDRYNLWYVQHCAAVEQTNFDENGEQRPPEKVLDAGHGGMRLDDFVEACNRALKQAGSKKLVTTAQVLSMRLYTCSTFRRMNSALRGFVPKVDGQIPLRACVQSARKGILSLQAIPRPPDSSFRGVTGYLATQFEAERMGMDYAFLSTSVNERIASEFAGSVATSVLFEVGFVAGCPGADISMLSLFPGEKEVLFAPCTGLSLRDSSAGATGAGAGQARVLVSPTAAI
jgi:hypothetical protein